MTISQIKKFIDPNFQSWFPYDDFNNIQQQCLPSILNTDENIIISAPTGSGKTTIFELAMIRALKQSTQHKILYLSPMRALCTEKAKEWSQKLGLVNKTCLELIGDNELKIKLEEADVILSTPEKWDYITRTFASNDLIRSISLIMIDEVHTLNDRRGAVLEAIISRMRIVLKNSQYRIVALSATIPNINNLSLWLRSSPSSPAKVIRFPDSMRPVPLKTHVISAQMNGKNGFTFDFSLNYKLPEVLSKYSDNKPTLIFCSTRKSTIKTCDFLCCNHFKECKEDKSEEITVELDDKNLQELLRKGLAYHHAGLSLNDREIVESLYRTNKINVLCSTSTLAIGVNLPAHLVIIKSTLQYTDSGYSEYSDLDIRQMIGRAGRAGYDTSGVAVILTSSETEHLYKSISEGKIEIDSQFLHEFIEFLNIEIANGNIKSFSEAMEWLSYSFLHIRMKLNPIKYSFKTTEPFQAQLQKSMELYLNDLKITGTIDLEDKEIIKSTPLGQSLARYFIKIKSLKDLLKNSYTDKTEIFDLLHLLTQNSELLSKIDFRIGDKVILTKIASDSRLNFPMPGKGKGTGKGAWESWKKPFLLIQVALQSELTEFEGKLTPIQRSDQQFFLDQSCRLLKFIIEVAQQNNLPLLLRNSLELLSSLHGRSWHSNPKLLQQVPGLGYISSKTLFNASIRSIEALQKVEESRLEVLLKRNPPFGRNLKKTLKTIFPELALDCDLKEKLIKISIKALSLGSKPSALVHLLVLAYKSPTLCRTLHYDHFPLSTLQNALTLSLDIKDYPETSYSCSLMLEDWTGLNQNICFDIKTGNVNQTNIIKSTEEYDFDLDESDYEIGNEDFFEEPTKKLKTENLSKNTNNTLSSRLSTSHPNIPPLSPLSTTQNQLDPNPSQKTSKCKHICKDKFHCAHICCKSGLLTSASSFENNSTITLAPLSKSKLSFLSNKKMSLTNAREYLRKYQPIPLDNNPNDLIRLQPKQVIESMDTGCTISLYDEIELVLRSIE